MIASPISFEDASGVRWTVAAHPAPRADAPRAEVLIFTSEAGERRLWHGVRPASTSWEDLSAFAWGALLQCAVPQPGVDDGRAADVPPPLY